MLGHVYTNPDIFEATYYSIQIRADETLNHSREG